MWLYGAACMVSVDDSRGEVIKPGAKFSVTDSDVCHCCSHSSQMLTYLKAGTRVIGGQCETVTRKTGFLCFHVISWCLVKINRIMPHSESLKMTCIWESTICVSWSLNVCTGNYCILCEIRKRSECECPPVSWRLQAAFCPAPLPHFSACEDPCC